VRLHHYVDTLDCQNIVVAQKEHKDSVRLHLYVDTLECRNIVVALRNTKAV
jgi:hypothetical protein